MKKRLFFVLSVVVMVFGCTTPKVYWENIDVTRSETDLEVSISYPYRFGGVDSVTNKINTAIDNFIKIGLAEECSECSIDSAVTVMYEEKRADSICALMKYEFYMKGSSYISGDTTCVHVEKSYYTGGANFYVRDEYLNFDNKTGNIIPAASMVADTAKALKIISEQLKARYPNQDGYSLFFGNVNVDNPPMPDNVGIDSTGYIFCYNMYEIAPRSTGVININIPFISLK